MTTRSPPCAPNVSCTTWAARVDSLFGSLYPPSVSSPKTPSPQTPALITATSATDSTGHRKRATHDPQPANTISPLSVCFSRKRGGLERHPAASVAEGLGRGPGQVDLRGLGRPIGDRVDHRVELPVPLLRGGRGRRGPGRQPGLQHPLARQHADIEAQGPVGGRGRRRDGESVARPAGADAGGGPVAVVDRVPAG